jgi:protein-L-isoaspartate(D-aspartate) O-methyltransferase
MHDYAQARLNMVENQLRPNRVDDPRILEAMGTVRRELFVPARLRGVAYGDEDLELGGGRFLIEPLSLGRMLVALRPGPEEVALVLGCDTGYAAVVLARLCATVFLLQEPGGEPAGIDQLLAELGADNVVTQTGPLAAGLAAQAPFDLILLGGSVPEVPPALLAQLGEGGRLVAVMPPGHAGKVTRFLKVGGAIGRTTPFDAAIPPCRALQPQPGFVF